MAVIDDKALKDFLESPVSMNSGLSIDKIADKAKGIGRFSVWLNNDKSRIKKILRTVKSNGVSPAFFAAYEKTEGYNSKWGWLNHTSPAGNPNDDAKSVATWLVNQSQSTSDHPAWIDRANYKDFVPQSVKNKGNDHFNSLPTGTIGKALIPATAAATWEVYYPKGLKKEYNGVKDYGKPITRMKNTIQDWGGSLGGGVTFLWPTGTENVTSGFRTSHRPDHHGIDIADGTVYDIVATADGTVTRSYVSNSYGEAVFIKHTIDGVTWESIYAHMQSGSRVVSKGDTVSQGDKLGIMGSTGNSRGLHLHFELHKGRWNADKTNAVDPEKYLESGNVKPPKPKPPEPDISHNYISLLLSNAVNGW